MARFNGFSWVMLVACAAMALLVKPTPGCASGFLGPEECSKKVSRGCGLELYTAMFEGSGVNDQCCQELVQIVGKECHDTMTANLVRDPVYAVNAPHFWRRSAQIWFTCVARLTGRIAPSPY
uniref:Prolamin-like domain-containing protein n=1 Tax=Nelumbo nucifera TaxID=4432 RepID=A0A822XL89_NELNU|nr:TPA_asm: hypothetical protein HUJ06_023847 [Nelumbo nucifera]